jgi:hypothetical protein
MNKEHILEEIKRTAKANAGAPLGRLRFYTETGIKESDWRGVHWVRWNDAVREAGFAPNQKAVAYSDELLLLKLATISRELGHFPIWPELRLKSRVDHDFPSDTAFRRFGSKPQMIAKVADYCRSHEGFEDVLTLCETLIQSDSATADEPAGDTEEIGFVYLLKSGRYHKIGKSNACGRRERELAIQLPEKAALVHQIQTDDPTGIERYWHQRFDSLRKNGEWFELSASEVRAFKRRKFM